jgi:hypothetical protein
VNVGASSSYSQNFNSLNGTTWTDNSTIAGWYATRTAIVQGTGSANAGAMYSFGSSGTPADRALGGLESNTTGAIAFGVQFNNNSGGVLTSINVAYVGEQWRQDPSTTPDVIDFYYKVATTADPSVTSSATDWTAVPALNFTNPKTGTASAIDGGASANRTSLSSTLTGISIPNGSYLFLKWVSSNVSGIDQGMSIDDLSVTWTRAVATAPTAPTITSITPGDGSLSVAFTAPSSDGGATISNYQYSTDNGGTFTAFSPARTTSPLSITGLVNNTTYSVQIKAVNSVGAGEASASVDGTPVAPAVPPSLTPSTYTGKVAVAFSQTIPATDSPTSFALATGTLPAGLSLDSDTGVISGQPSAAGSFSVTVTASNSSGSSSPATIDFTIDKGDQSITGLAATATKFTTDVPYSLTATVNSGLPLTYASDNLAVATVDSSGTVTTVGVGTANITVSQAGTVNYLAASVTQVLTVSPSPIWTNPITGTNPNTSSPYTTGDVKNSNVAVSGIARGSGISGTDANNRYTATGWNSGSFDTTKYFEFTITPNSGYQVSLASFVYTGQASGTGPISVALRSSDDAYASNVGSATIAGTTISLSASTYQNISQAITFRLYAWGASSSGGTFSVNDFSFNGTVGVVSSSAPTITSSNAFSGTVGVAFSNTITATGSAPIAFSGTDLPGGLSVATNGVISGTPTAAGTFTNVVLTATNVAGTNNQAATFTIAKGTPSITEVPTASAITAGAALSSSTLTGGSASVEGTFYWNSPSAVPESTGSYEVTFTPTDTANYNTATTTVSVTVNPAGTTYSGWLSGAGASDAAFLDYVFGAATPGTLDPSLKPTVAVTGGNLVLTYYVRQGTVGLTVTPKTSADLAAAPGDWVEVIPVDVDVAREVNGIIVQQKTASVPVSGTKKFLRVEAVQQ